MGCNGSKDDTISVGAAASIPPLSPLQRKSTIASLTDDVRLTEKVALDFDHVMSLKVGHEALVKFAVSEYSDENMRFWTDVRDFKVLCGIPEVEAASAGRPETPRDTPREPATFPICDEPKMQEAADNIIRTYLCSSAEVGLNMSTAHQKLFPKQPAPGMYEYNPHMFDQVHAQVPRRRRTPTRLPPIPPFPPLLPAAPCRATACGPPP